VHKLTTGHLRARFEAGTSEHEAGSMTRTKIIYL